MPDSTSEIKIIDEFRGDYAFLSNFHIVPVEYHCHTYISAEHAYQAEKAITEEDRKFVASAPTCKIAKYRGNNIKIWPDWNLVKVAEMKHIVLAKFIQNEHIAEKLIKTGNAILIEGNWWGDTFWGMYKGKGENYLGKILMNVRDFLKESWYGRKSIMQRTESNKRQLS